MFSRDRQYRYVLRRVWAPDKPAILFIGLNPSTADHRIDDPTIRRCIRFARDWGFGQLLVGNLFAYRTPWPRVMHLATKPVGPRNDSWLVRLSEEAAVTVAAWGNGGRYQDRDTHVLPLLRSLRCLGTTKQGLPLHPLYLRATTKLRDLKAKR